MIGMHDSGAFDRTERKCGCGGAATSINIFDAGPRDYQDAVIGLHDELVRLKSALKQFHKCAERVFDLRRKRYFHSRAISEVNDELFLVVVTHNRLE